MKTEFNSNGPVTVRITIEIEGPRAVEAVEAKAAEAKAAETEAVLAVHAQQAQQTLAKAVQARAAPPEAAPYKPRPRSKTEVMIELLRRPEGVTNPEAQRVLGWPVGTYSTVVAERMGRKITKSQRNDGLTVYRIT